MSDLRRRGRFSVQSSRDTGGELIKEGWTAKSDSSGNTKYSNTKGGYSNLSNSEANNISRSESIGGKQELPSITAGSIMSPKTLPRYKKGGKVKKTGPAIVHKGEQVLTKKQAAKPSVKKAIGKSKPSVKKAIGKSKPSVKKAIRKRK